MTRVHHKSWIRIQKSLFKNQSSYVIDHRSVYSGPLEVQPRTRYKGEQTKPDFCIFFDIVSRWLECPRTPKCSNAAFCIFVDMRPNTALCSPNTALCIPNTALCNPNTALCSPKTETQPRAAQAQPYAGQTHSCVHPKHSPVQPLTHPPEGQPCAAQTEPCATSALCNPNTALCTKSLVQPKHSP